MLLPKRVFPPFPRLFPPDITATHKIQELIQIETNSFKSIYLPISLDTGFQLAQFPGAGTRDAGGRKRAGHPGQLQRNHMLH